MAGLTNCRAECYGLENMSWIEVKLKAGRIVPAFASTTAAIAGLQTAEMVKLLCLRAEKAERENVEALCRNSFLNLGVPLLSMSEPGPIKRRAVSDRYFVDEWSILEFDLTPSLTMAELIEKLEVCTGLKVWDIFREEECVLL